MALNPTGYMLNPNGHVWATLPEEEGGGVNRFALEAGIHNGPICIKCGYTFCEHCAVNQPLPPCTGA